MVGMPFAKLVKDNPYIYDILTQALADLNGRIQELQITIPELERTFDVLISSIDDSLGNMTGWLIQFNDISEQKQFEANLETTRKTHEEILGTLTDSYFEVDLTGILTYANNALVANLGHRNVQDVVGKNFRHFIHRNSVRDVFDKFRILYETKQPIKSFEYYL